MIIANEKKAWFELCLVTGSWKRCIHDFFYIYIAPLLCICKEILVHTLNCSLKEYKFASIPFIFMCTNQTILNSSSTFYLKTSNLIWLLLPSPQIKFSSDTTSISEKRRLSCLHTKLLMEHLRTTKWEKGRIVSYSKCWERGIQWKNDFLCDKLFICSLDIHFNI